MPMADWIRGETIIVATFLESSSMPTADWVKGETVIVVKDDE